MSLAAEVGGIAVNGEALNFASADTDTGNGITNGKITEDTAVVGLGPAKLERDFVPVAVEARAAFDSCGGFIKFRARENVRAP